MSKHKHERNGDDESTHWAARAQQEFEQVQFLAYKYWQERGCPEGDSETDWLRAEHEVVRQREAAKRL